MVSSHRCKTLFYTLLNMKNKAESRLSGIKETEKETIPLNDKQTSIIQGAFFPKGNMMF